MSMILSGSATKFLEDTEPGNVYVCPGPNGIIINSPSNIKIYSGTRSSAYNQKTFVDIEIYSLQEHIKIYKDELVLEGKNKEKLGKEFIDFLYDSFIVGENSFVNINDYFKYYPNINKFFMKLKDDKLPSTDWFILEKICSRYMNLKAFW